MTTSSIMELNLDTNSLYVFKDNTFTKTEDKAFFESGYCVVISKKLTKADLAEITSKALSHDVELAFMAPFSYCGNEVMIAKASSYNEAFNQELKLLPSKIDAIHVKHIPTLEQPGVILLDMDSTCIQIECIDEIARAYGVGEQIAEITSQAMHGKLDFKQSLRKRVGLLKDAPESILTDLRNRLPIMPGFPELVKLLQEHNWKVAIASGGFMQFVSKLKEDFNLTLVRANTFEIVNGSLTGGLIGEIVDSTVKVATLNELCETYNIPNSQSIAIGDGANDLPMIKASGLGFAIHAKPIVREQAPATINNFGLDAAACVLEAATRISKI